MQDENQYVDLNPLFKRVSSLLGRCYNWVKLRAAFIIIVFIAINLFFVTKSFLSSEKYLTVELMESEVLSNDEVMYVLESLEENLQKNSVFAVSSDLTEESKGLNTLTDIEYEIVFNLKDQYTIKSMNYTDSLAVNFNGPIKVSLTSTTSNDSLGLYFINYLNNHSYIEKKREHYEFKMNQEKNDLAVKIDLIDSLISKIEPSTASINSDDVKNIVIGTDKEYKILELLQYRGELLDDLSEIEMYLKTTSGKELSHVSGNIQSQKIEKEYVFSILTYIKHLFLSIFIILFIDLLISLFRK